MTDQKCDHIVGTYVSLTDKESGRSTSTLHLRRASEMDTVLASLQKLFRFCPECGERLDGKISDERVITGRGSAPGPVGYGDDDKTLLSRVLKAMEHTRDQSWLRLLSDVEDALLVNGDPTAINPHGVIQARGYIQWDSRQECYVDETGVPMAIPCEEASGNNDGEPSARYIDGSTEGGLEERPVEFFATVEYTDPVTTDRDNRNGDVIPKDGVCPETPLFWKHVNQDGDRSASAEDNDANSDEHKGDQPVGFQRLGKYVWAVDLPSYVTWSIVPKESVDPSCGILGETVTKKCACGRQIEPDSDGNLPEQCSKCFFDGKLGP